MSTFKCKMCGGTLEIQNGSTVAECEYCGTKQTIPKLDDEKRANLYDRANHFRRSNEFDKASAIYEQILAEDGTDAEAYWSLVLCRYGIEYVEDPLSHRRVPTVHRTQYTSIFDDDNYKFALKNSDTYQRVIYEEEAKAINEIQKGILAISQKEEPFDVFICYKETDDSGKRTHDSVLAQDLYYQLKQEGFKVFFSRVTLEDKLGSAYEPYIFAALNSAKVMVVLGTKTEHFNAVWVKNEWSRFISLIRKGEKKVLIPAYKDMDPYDLPKEFSHLQAQDMSKLGFMQDLIRGIKKILGRDKKPVATTVERVIIQGNSGMQSIDPLLRRALLFLEDGEFDNADEYAEKVLDINPECAEAYVVKLLIELRLKNLADLSQCKAPISDSHNYQKALRFASTEYRETIEGYNNAIIKRIDTARKDELYARGVELMKLQRYDEAIQNFEKIPKYKDSTQKIEYCKKLAEEKRRDNIYQRAIQLLGVGQFYEAIRLFGTIEDYKDSKEKIKLCEEKSETARKDTIYSKALKRTADLNASDADIKKSIEELQSISGYKDVDEQINALNARIEKRLADSKRAEEEARIKAEEARRTREREAELRRIATEKKKKTKKKVATIGASGMGALAILLVLLFTLVIPLIRYNKADELLNAGKYGDAMEIYQDIGSFSDSEQRITVLTGIEKINEADFEEGIEKILSAGVPVKLIYGMGGGDFSDATYFNTATTANELPLATMATASAPEIEYTYNSTADFEGIQTPVRSGYRFVEWGLETFNYRIGDTFEIRLGAVWGEKEYIIAYDLNGGKVSTENPNKYGIEDDSFTLVNPTKEGYTFIGWTGTDLNGITMAVTIEKGSIGNRSYEANWRANTYTIAFDASGGTVAPVSMIVIYNKVYMLPTATRIGYTFAGWYNGNTQYTSGIWTGLAGITLTARWTAKDYNITFDDTAGIGTTATITYNYNYSGVPSSTVTLINGQTLSRPANPTRSGYVFTGWYTNSSCTTRYGFTGTITEDMTLYAGWKEMSLPSVYSETEINPADYASSTENYSVSTNYTYSSSKKHIYLVAEETGIHYIYWKNSKSYSYSGYYLQIYNLTTDTTIRSSLNTYSTIYQNCSFTCSRGDVIVISLYRYDSYYTSTAYFYFGGFDAPATSTATASLPVGGCEYKNNSTYIDSVAYGENYTLPVLTRTGYTFDGWYNGSTKVESGAWSIADNVTLTGKWTANTYTVTFDANGGSVSPTSKTATYESSFTLPTPTWDGHAFSGWYNDSENITSGTWEYTTGMTLTARWDVINYTITYTLNGGTNNSSNPSTYTINDAFTLQDPIRVGYTFLGWTYSGQTTPTQTVTVAEGTTCDLSYTANWQANTHTVTFDASGGTVSPTSKDATFDTNVTLPMPTRTGYTFGGWFVGTKQYATGTWETDSDVTLIAKWSVNSYNVTYDDVSIETNEITVTFNYNYSGSTATTVTLLNGEKLNYPANPTRSGYIFTGWYTNSSCTTTYNFSGTITEDMTLYAGWNTCTITNNSAYAWSSSGGVLTSTNKSNSSSSTYKITATMPVIISFSYKTSSEANYDKLIIAKNGTALKECSGSTSYVSYSVTLASGDYLTFTYQKDSSQASGSDCAYIKDVTYTSNVSYTSTATASCGTVAGLVYDATSTYVIPVTFDENVTLFEPFRVGYTFDGWYNGSTKVESGAWSIADNVTLTGKWTANTYTVTFDANGGSVSPTSQQVTYDETYTVPTPTRTGYTFAGWYSGGVKYAGGTWATAGHTTLIASWTANSGIPYVVNHYKQNIAGTGYEAPEVQNLTGTAGALLTPSVKYYTGFTAPSAKTVTIAPDGTLVVDYYYTRNSYTITMVNNSGKTLTAIMQKYQSAVTMPNATREGYTFGGWFTDIDLTTAFTATTMPASDITVYAWWKEENKAGDFTYSGSSEISISGYSGAETTVVVPSYIGGKLVANINDSAFANKTTITKVTIPTTVEKIGASIFAGCTSLQELVVPFIGSGASLSNFGHFFGTTSVSGTVETVQNSVKYYIPQSLRTVTITKQSNIPAYAFYNCDLIETINLPSTVESIGSYAFYNCSALKQMNSDNENTLNMPTGLLTIGDSAFANVATVKTVIVPETVTYIGKRAFYGSKMTSLTIPFVGASENSTSDAGVTLGHIFGYGSRDYSSDYLTSAGSGYTSQWGNSTSSYKYQFYIPNTLRTVTITKQTKIPYAAFMNCDLITSITLPDNTISIGGYAFYNCKKLSSLNSNEVGEINIPSYVTAVEKYTFYNCKESSQVSLSDKVTAINDYAFYGCSAIVQFNSTTLGEMITPASCEKIGPCAFYGLVAITSLKVADMVSDIESTAFGGMSRLQEMTVPFIGDGNKTSADIYQYPLGYFFGTSYYSGGTSTIQYYHGSSTTSTTYSTYYIPTALTKVVVTIGDLNYGAFYGCSKITSITVNENAVVNAEALHSCPATLSYASYTMPNYAWDGRTVATGYHSGSGTSNNPYTIANGDELAFFAQQVNAGVTYEGVYFKLSYDISLGNYEFGTIGTDLSYFKGVFDGDCHMIRGLRIYSHHQYVGLFSQTSGTIKNLGVYGSVTQTTETNLAAAGMLVGQLLNGGTISDCYTVGTLTSNSTYTIHCGGLVGYSKGTIADSYSSAHVKAISSSLISYAGGLIGYIEGTVTNSVAFGDVYAKGSTDSYSRNGGFVGASSESATITNCYRSNAQILTKNGVANTAYNELGTTGSISTILNFCGANWDGDKWDVVTMYPLFK